MRVVYCKLERFYFYEVLNFVKVICGFRIKDDGWLIKDMVG